MHAERQPIVKIVAARWQMNLTHEEVKPYLGWFFAKVAAACLNPESFARTVQCGERKQLNSNHVSIPIKTTAEKNDVPFCSLLNRGAEAL